MLLLFDVFEVGILLAAWLLASWCYRADEDHGDGYDEGSWESERRSRGVDARKELRKTKVKRAQGALMIIFYIMIVRPSFRRNVVARNIYSLLTAAWVIGYNCMVIPRATRDQSFALINHHVE